MRRTVAVLVQWCFLVQLFGCTRTLSTPADNLAAIEPDVTTEPGARIFGYVTSDGISHEFTGWVKLEEDEFLFRPAVERRRGETIGSQAPPFRLPRTEVASFSTREIHVGKTILLIAALVAPFGLLLGAANWPEF